MTTSDFPLHYFAEPDRANRTTVQLHEMFISAGSTFSTEEFSRALAAALAESPDPDLAVTNLLRFAEATINKAALFNDLVQHRVLMELVVKMVSYSQYFADIFVRDPELFRWLTASDALVRPRRKAFLREEAGRALTLFQKPERKLDALKRLYRREILRIGARDILGEADLKTLTEELSFLADVLVDAACGVAHQQLSDRYAGLPLTPYAVIGLGKLGGAELNYSSDIDIMFVYRDEGEFENANGRTHTYHEYFNAFVEKLVQNLSQVSTEGHLYRVDTRLRPESGAGPLARSLQSYLLYYEARGELWERQMLMKARPVAGDLAFGEEFIAALKPFVYPRSFLESPLQSIARIKARIEAAVAGEENVKLRAGGIRDIEFIVQALQMMNGGKREDIRSRNTLDALDRLHAARLLSDEEKATLSEAYVLFRTIEHRLQMMLNTQTHEVPRDDRSLQMLARKVGLSSAADLRKRFEKLRTAVRNIFTNVVMGEADSGEVSVSALVEGNASPEAIANVLTRFKFSDRKKAARNFNVLLTGSSLNKGPVSARVQSSLREVAEDVFREIGATPLPDLTLHNLALVSSSHKFPEQLYEQLKQPGFRNMLITICARSPKLAKGFVASPLLLDRIAADPGLFAGRSEEQLTEKTNLVAYKRSEELRAGVQYVLGIFPFDELSRELSTIADAIVSHVVEDELRGQEKSGARFAVFAVGKYGTHEINFDSDLDLLFVGSADAIATHHMLETIGVSVVKRLSIMNEWGKLYDVDARLRPEGKSAPLVVDANAFGVYLQSRASLWERQSFTRLRFIAGDKELGDAVKKEVAEYVYAAPLPAQWVEEIVTMRKKTESRSRASSADFVDIKLSAGGMVDIEFLAQMLQLKHAARNPELRHVPTAAALERGCELENVTQLGETLIRHYAFYREIETAIRLGLEEKGTILPDEEKLRTLALLLGLPDGEELLRRVTRATAETRRIFLDIVQQLQSGIA